MTPSFKLTAKQNQANLLLSGNQRHTCLVGGARSGKTFILVRATTIRAMRAGQTRHAILRFRQNAVHRSIALDTFPKMMRLCFPGVPYKEYRQDSMFLLPNQSEIWLSGLDEDERVDKILGQEYITLFFNECSQIPYISITTALTRLAQKHNDLTQRAYYDLNPTGKSHWSNKQFGLHVDPITGAPLLKPNNYKRMFLNPEDNKENLDDDYLESLQAMPPKQRARFYEGQYVDEINDALWSLESIAQSREEARKLEEILPTLVKVVIGVDPSGAASPEDVKKGEIGIVVAGIDARGHGYVLADKSLRDNPQVWGKVVTNAFRDYMGDRVVAEINYGGEMVRFVVKAQNPSVPVVVVTASRGKHVRAEPIAALYAQGRVSHVGHFPELEDQLCGFSSEGYGGETSPDRADALIWALTSLMLADSQDEPIGLPVQAGAGVSIRSALNG